MDNIIYPNYKEQIAQQILYHKKQRKNFEEIQRNSKITNTLIRNEDMTKEERKN